MGCREGRLHHLRKSHPDGEVVGSELSEKDGERFARRRRLLGIGVG